jgi:energy-coupling factor transporter ATP-binding protein EcfA2
MRLLRVQVPDFRVLQNVDITFEKDFFPNIFPLGSQNGGGKSTLLQLIFGLLHCSGNPDRVGFLKNLLYGFKIDNRMKPIALIDIWDGEKNVQLEFFANKDSDIKNLLSNKEIRQDHEDLFRFSAEDKLEAVKNKISNLEKQIRQLEKSLDRLELFKKIENDQEKTSRLKAEIRELRELELISQSRRLLDIIRPAKSLYYNVMPTFEEVQDEIQQILEISKINLKESNDKRQQLDDTLEEVSKCLQSQKLLYICNYSASGDEVEDDVLLCRVDNIEISKGNSFFKSLSEKIFLAAPATQVFLFLYPKYRKLLFSVFGEQTSENDYYVKLRTAKSALPGFFTYDFLAVDVFIESFKAARDRDFREAIETGEYGNSYKTLINDLNLVLANKKINIDKDLSSITFKLDKDGETRDLYPEDLSHGELKRLSIYMWLKYYNIENAIVLMDEIEIAFHPDWQYQIIADLKEWAPNNQYILATHSYELCEALTPSHVKELDPKLLKQKASN